MNEYIVTGVLSLGTAILGFLSGHWKNRASVRALLLDRVKALEEKWEDSHGELLAYQSRETELKIQITRLEAQVSILTEEVRKLRSLEVDLEKAIDRAERAELELRKMRESRHE